VTKLLFYLFALVLIAAALRVITARNPVHCALSLVLAFVASSGLWLLLETEFLAVVLVLVYVGAVMVLFLFVVMMLDINLVPLREGFIRYLPVGALVALLIVVQLAMVVGPGTFGIEQVPRPAPLPADYSNTEALGVLLYTVYVYPFELAAVILLVAIVAAIALTMRRREGLRSRPPHEQVRVRREERVRLVKMPAESDR
jgi:NADH-quinone oxidoreductase subunit J